MLAVRFSAQLTRGSRRGQSEIDGLFKTSDGTVWHQSCATKHVLALSLLTNKRELYLSCRLHILPTYKLYVKTHLIYQLHWKCVSTIGLPSGNSDTHSISFSAILPSVPGWLPRFYWSHRPHALLNTVKSCNGPAIEMMGFRA